MAALESEVITALLSDLGVPASALVLEADSRNTQGNASFSRERLAPWGVNRESPLVFLLSRRYHPGYGVRRETDDTVWFRRGGALRAVPGPAGQHPGPGGPGVPGAAGRVVGLINAFNLVDGIEGLAGGVSGPAAARGQA